MFSEYSSSRVIGLVFSASYCRWCSAFTPVLDQLFPELSQVGIDLLMVGSDQSEQVFNEYCSKFSWKHIAFDDPMRKTLRDIYGIDTIPALVFVNDAGQVIDREGRSTISDLMQLYEPRDLARQLEMRFADITYNSDEDW